MHFRGEQDNFGELRLEVAMADHSFRDVLYFTLAWGALAVTLIAAQPGPFMHGMPKLIRPAEAAQTASVAQPARILLASAMENAE